MTRPPIEAGVMVALWSDDAAAFVEHLVDPFVGEYAVLHTGKVIAVPFLVGKKALEQVGCVLARNDNDAEAVGDDDVSRVHHNTATAYRVVDLPRAAMQRTDRSRASGEDGEVEGQNLRQIPNVTVDDEPSQLPMFGFGGDQASQGQSMD